MEYEAAAKAPLKFKGGVESDIKKYDYVWYFAIWLLILIYSCRKKKKKTKEKVKEAENPKSAEQAQTSQQSQKIAIVKTKAQLKFEQMKEEQLKRRILDKASKTHKQRVEEFNRHLDSLTEHFDIPKVSWTKWLYTYGGIIFFIFSSSATQCDKYTFRTSNMTLIYLY